MKWLDDQDPRVRSAVVSGGYGRAPHSDHAYPPPIPDAVDTIVDALEVASETLERYTGFAIHPAGVAVEDFVATPQVTRLSPTFTPVREILAIHANALGEVATAIDPGDWSVTGNAVTFGQPRYLAPTLEWWWRRSCSDQVWADMHITLQYSFGSTISAGARRAVIALAHDIWLESSACEGCTLPANTTMVVREGLTLDLDPSQRQGRTGIPVVDSWLDAVNPHHMRRKSGVYTPSSPPPVTRSLRTARPEWGSGLHLTGGAVLGVGAS